MNFTTNCPIHGINVDSYVNGRCISCQKDMQLVKRHRITKEAYTTMQVQSGIGEIYKTSSFDNYEITNKQQQSNIDQLKDYTFNQNLMVLGKIGAGKTHLICALLNKFIMQDLEQLTDEDIDEISRSEQKLSVKYKYIKYYKLSDLKYGNQKEFDALSRYKYLVIDEIGSTQTDFKLSLLFEIIDERYSNGLHTVLISNLTTDMLKAIINDALYSRLKQNCMTLNFDWEGFQDYRIKS